MLILKDNNGVNVKQQLKNADIPDGEIGLAKLNGTIPTLPISITDVTNLETTLNNKGNVFFDSHTRIAGCIPKFTDTDYIDNSLIIEKDGLIGIGLTPTTYELEVNGRINTSHEIMVNEVPVVLETDTRLNQIVYTVKKVLTPTNIRALYSTPYTLIAAQGAGKIINVVNVSYFYQYATAAYSGGSSAINAYVGGLAQFGTISVDGTQNRYGILPRLNNNTTTQDLRNQALTLLADSAISGASATGTLTLIINYTIDNYN